MPALRAFISLPSHAKNFKRHSAPVVHPKMILAAAVFFAQCERRCFPPAGKFLAGGHPPSSGFSATSCFGAASIGDHDHQAADNSTRARAAWKAPRSFPFCRTTASAGASFSIGGKLDFTPFADDVVQLVRVPFSVSRGCARSQKTSSCRKLTFRRVFLHECCRIAHPD